ncbi:uncharacterized protein LOC127290084 [Leptopilina boulardi]|uniref:uncharacterized protein LOC127290084 n=1 Tax=Leptopilina boulardi TaxID=63433 RepID=UPI0021F56A9D|nr:uncharacterized protein LOC127290084 [Leptopilina boulardi]
MVKCMLCRRVYNKAFDISFHRFPSDQATRKIWCKIMNHGLIAPTDRICSQHFTDDCFQVHKELGQRILKPYSVPTLAMTKIQEPTKVTCSIETVLTDHNYVARLEDNETIKSAEPAKLLIKYPYVLNTPPCNITPNIIMPDVKFNMPVTYQPLVPNISQPFSGKMLYALKINQPVNRINSITPTVIPKIVKNSIISTKEEAKRKALLLKKKKEELKIHETTVKKLQSASKKVKDQRQTIKMLRQKLRRLERRFELQKTLIKHLNSKLEVPKESRQITLIAAGHFE